MATTTAPRRDLASSKSLSALRDLSLNDTHRGRYARAEAKAQGVPRLPQLTIDPTAQPSGTHGRPLPSPPLTASSSSASDSNPSSARSPRSAFSPVTPSSPPSEPSSRKNTYGVPPPRYSSLQPIALPQQRPAALRPSPSFEQRVAEYKDRIALMSAKPSPSPMPENAIRRVRSALHGATPAPPPPPSPTPEQPRTARRFAYRSLLMETPEPLRKPRAPQPAPQFSPVYTPPVQLRPAHRHPHHVAVHAAMASTTTIGTIETIQTISSGKTQTSTDSGATITPANWSTKSRAAHRIGRAFMEDSDEADDEEDEGGAPSFADSDAISLAPSLIPSVYDYYADDNGPVREMSDEDLFDDAHSPLDPFLKDFPPPPVVDAHGRRVSAPNPARAREPFRRRPSSAPAPAPGTLLLPPRATTLPTLRMPIEEVGRYERTPSPLSPLGGAPSIISVRPTGLTNNSSQTADFLLSEPPRFLAGYFKKRADRARQESVRGEDGTASSPPQEPRKSLGSVSTKKNPLKRVKTPKDDVALTENGRQSTFLDL